VLGTTGWIQLPQRFHYPSRIVLHRDGHDPETIDVRLTGAGYTHELIEVTERVAHGDRRARRAAVSTKHPGHSPVDLGQWPGMAADADKRVTTARAPRRLPRQDRPGPHTSSATSTIEVVSYPAVWAEAVDAALPVARADPMR
jgi:hypothetical protein